MRPGLISFIIAVLVSCAVLAARADICGICGQEIHGTIYLMTDKVTGNQVEVCSKCIQLPRCFICGLPVKDGVQLPDGRWLCARDAKTAVLDVDDVRRIFWNVHDDLNHLYARFTSFPTNVDVSVIDRVDVDSMFQLAGNEFESPDLLGVTQPITTNGVKRYEISLLTGQPVPQLEEVCAHELSHAWVGENVPPERHARLARDAEEGFCEMMGYLLMDSKGDEAEKKQVLANAYTRGQVNLFIEAEQEYGFNDVLDWMQYGVGSQLQPGHIDEIRDVKIPAPASETPLYSAYPAETGPITPPRPPSTLELQGILWSSVPSAIINGQSFFVGDQFKVPLRAGSVTIRCLAIAKDTVQIQNVDTGAKQELTLPAQ